MESHVINPSYHHAPLRSIGYKTLRMMSDSLSSESSCNANSPEYPQISVTGKQNSGSTSDWYSNQSIASQSYQDTSSENDCSDEEYNMKESEGNAVYRPGVEDDMETGENIEVCQVNVEDEVDEEMEMDNIDLNLSTSTDDHSLVEGHDYEVIVVYTVNPNLELLEPSSEDDGEEYVTEKNSPVNDDNSTSYTCQDGVDIGFEAPIVSNVDEYFVKNDRSEQNILNVDQPVVQNVDEYFLDLGSNAPVPNVDDYFINHKLPEKEKPHFELPDSSTKNELFFLTDNNKNCEEIGPEPDTETNIVDISIDESDLKALPKIDDLKKYLIDDMTYTKFRQNQKTCSVPPSPMQNICIDVDDTKSYLNFDYLNLDLSNRSNGNEKAGKQGKSEDVLRTLTEDDINSFICKYSNTDDAIDKQNQDDLNPQDMEIETTISSGPPLLDISSSRMTSTPIPTLLNYCIEKTSEKAVTPVKESKIDLDDFVDVESCNDTAIPVLEANNLSSLLEQFEATEQVHTKKAPEPIVNFEDSQLKSCNKNTLTNGMRLQDAAMQLNKNKMRQILMPTPINSTIRRSESPVHSDHDYCSPKKRHSLPNLKKGQSLLKPEVLSSNNKILNSRHRSCKSKKVVYHLSSDEESESKNSKHKKVSKLNDIDLKKKNSVKPSVKPPVQSNCRKKLSPPYSDNLKIKNKTNNSVMLKSACKASDNCSQNSNSSIKLTIKNKSEVILNCDYKDSQKDKTLEVNCKNSDDKKMNNIDKEDKSITELEKNKCTIVVKSPRIEEKPHSKSENFYTGLFNNKKELQIPKPLVPKVERNPFEDELIKCTQASIKKEEQPLKKKKLNLQEYKLRRGVSSNASSAQVSPEAIFPDMPSPGLEKAVKCPVVPKTPNGLINTAEKVNNEQKFFDPIKEASRKILMNSKKLKAEAIRKRDEDIVMSKIPKVENFQLQPLISDAEMEKIVGMNKPESLKLPIAKERPRIPINFEEIILVSMGVNTHKDMFQNPPILHGKTKSTSPPADSKSMINFKIKKSDHVLKQNVFDIMKRENRIPIEQKKQEDIKINKERYKDITAALKSVKKQVDTKISSNSLFASIQDVVMKKAPENVAETYDARHLKSKSNLTDKSNIKCPKTTIVREYDSKVEHGEDKVILHLAKHRSKPKTNNVLVQTDPIPEFTSPPSLSPLPETPLNRKRNDSDMSLSSDVSPPCRKEIEEPVRRSREKVIQPKEVRPNRIEKEQKEKRSRSKDRFKYRCTSRSTSRSCRRRSRSRSQSRSHGRYRRYRRSDSPYKRKRRSRSRSYHKRRSPSVRRDRSKASKSESKSPRSSRPEARSKTPVKRFKPNPLSNSVEKKSCKSLTPPLRKPTVSESSDSSSSSSSSSSSASSSSSSSSSSSESQRSGRSFKRDATYKNNYRGYSSEDRESNTPVEERRIVFVGRLEKNITKAHLRSQFVKFGPVMEVRLHSKEDGSRYGFVTYQHSRDAWSAVEAANTFPQYDVGFGGRRAFCRQSYADLDGLEAKYTESAFHGAVPVPVARRDNDMPFDQMLLEMKRKLHEYKNEKKRED